MSRFEHTGFGLALPQVYVGEPIDPGAIAAFARRAEAAGYSGLWTQDQAVGRADVLEPLSLLAFVAAATERIRIGVSVLVFPRRNPVVLAKVAATVDQLSRGRLDLGIGIGRAGPGDAAFGLDDADRLSRFLEGLQIMKRLWAGEAVRHAGRHWTLADVSIAPRPCQRPHPPVWFGVGHPRALRRAVRLGDGWMGAGSSTLEQFREQARLVRELLDEAGRDAATFRVAKRVYLAVDEDAARARRRLEAWFGAYYGDAEMATRVSVWGSAAAIGERIAQIIESGADTVLLNPVFDPDRHLEELARIVGPR